MASKDSLTMRKLAAKGVVQQVATNTPVAFKLQHVASDTVTSVVVTSATDVVLTTSTGAKTYTFAALTTVGAIVDAINADGFFEAKVLDCLRSLGSDDNLVAGTLTITTDEDRVPCYKIFLNTDVSLQLGAVISPFRSFGAPKGHSVKLQEIKYYGTITGAVDRVQVWIRKGRTETQVFGVLSVNATLTTINWASGAGFIGGGVDEEVVVLFKDAAMSDATTNFLQISGLVE